MRRLLPAHRACPPRARRPPPGLDVCGCRCFTTLEVAAELQGDTILTTPPVTTSVSGAIKRKHDILNKWSNTDANDDCSVTLATILRILFFEH